MKPIQNCFFIISDGIPLKKIIDGPSCENIARSGSSALLKLFVFSLYSLTYSCKLFCTASDGHSHVPQSLPSFKTNLLGSFEKNHVYLSV